MGVAILDIYIRHAPAGNDGSFANPNYAGDQRGDNIHGDSSHLLGRVVESEDHYMDDTPPPTARP